MSVKQEMVHFLQTRFPCTKYLPSDFQTQVEVEVQTHLTQERAYDEKILCLVPCLTFPGESSARSHSGY